MTTTRPIPIRPGTSRARDRQDREERRVDDVELFFDREGPEVEQGRGRLLRVEVVRSDGGEVEVGQEHCRPAAVDRRRVAVTAPKTVGRDDGPHDHERRGGDDAAAAASVEPEERGPTRRSVLEAGVR